MIDEQELRAFANEYINHAGAIVTECGVVGGHVEEAQADVARKLLELLDTMTARSA